MNKKEMKDEEEEELEMRRSWKRPRISRSRRKGGGR